MDDDGFISFAPPPDLTLSKSRRTAAMNYVERALAATAPMALKLQRAVISEALSSDDLAYKKLGLQAADSVLDRFMGKAQQSVSVSMEEQRPVMFDGKLAQLNAAMEAAVDAKHRINGENTAEAYAREVTKGMVDEQGVII